MMTYKQALLLLLQHPKRSSRSMVFSYVLAAFGAMAVVFGVCHSAYIMGVPWWIFKQQGIPREHLWELIPIDAIGLFSLCIGLVAAFVGLVKAHYKSLEVVRVLQLKTRHAAAVSSEQRLSRWTIAAAITFVLGTLLLLPQVIVVLGLYQTANSSLMLDDAVVPLWVYLLQAAFSFTGMLVLLFLGLYFRLVFSYKHN